MLCSVRPDIILTVDWALKINHLSTLCGRGKGEVVGEGGEVVGRRGGRGGGDKVRDTHQKINKN